MRDERTPEELEAAGEALGISAEELEQARNYLAGDSKWIVAGGPVDVRTFVTSPAYLNALDGQGNSVLYPAVLDALAELVEGGYSEAVLTGAIGTGKTTLAVYRGSCPSRSTGRACGARSCETARAGRPECKSVTRSPYARARA